MFLAEANYEGINKMKRSSDFFEINIEDLPDFKITIPSDVYLYLERSRRYVIYKKIGYTLNLEDTARLKLRGIEKFYFSKNDLSFDEKTFLETLASYSNDSHPLNSQQEIEVDTENTSDDQTGKLEKPRTEAGSVLQFALEIEETKDKQIILDILTQTIETLGTKLNQQKILLDAIEALNIETPSLRRYFSILSTKGWHTEGQKKIFESLLVTYFSR